MDTTDLWIQDKIRSKKMQLSKVLGVENMADALTKCIDRTSMTSALSRMGIVKLDGRPACVLVAMGA